MATFNPYSQSPRLSDRASPRLYAGNPMTPIHSPHHSVTSSVSSRTPVHTLTLHEYRKQQHTPVPAREGTPRKTLRRKPSALTLNDTERAASVPPSTWSNSGPPLRPIHFSQSAHQLKSTLPPFQQQTQSDLPFRAQSTEPHHQTGSISSSSTLSSSSKVRYFNPRKRLPRPPATSGSITYPPSINTKSTKAPPATLSLSTERTNSSGAQTTPSTFSLSRFPQPPYRNDPSLSPPQDEIESARVDPLRFTTNSPTTPPATPAIIHYRGASFDLVNPHDSLLLHDIVTPSRDFDSSDYFPVRTSVDEYSEMAPKRAMYGDFHAAHAGILKRPGDSPGQSYADLPAPPSPAALSPISSSYTSPMYSPESADIPSPLFVKTPARESRFSLKGLTRTLTQKLGKGPAKPQDEELRDIHNHNVSTETLSVNMEFPRSLNSQTPAPEPAYVPVNPMSPVTLSSPTSHESFPTFSPGPDEVEVSQKHSLERYETQPLASMVPDEPSTQTGRIDDSQLLVSEGGSLAKPYYDDLDSIYPSSSIYTGDGHRKSRYQQSISSNRNSNLNPFARYGTAGAKYVPNDHYESLREQSSQNRDGHPMPLPYSQDMFHGLADEADPKTDTISKLIDDYNPHNTAGATEDVVPAQPEFGRHGTPLQNTDTGFSGRPIVAQSSGSPPCEAPPLAPAFEYGRPTFFSSSPEFSGILSKGSAYSYGDTQNLLQIPHSGIPVQPGTAQNLISSSSYSQPEAKPFEPSSSYSQVESYSPHTPKEALDQAEHLFQDTVDRHRSDNKIPAMWSRRQSGSQLLNKPATKRASVYSGGNDAGTTEERADWETVGGNSRDSKGHESLGSVADYSSSEGTRDSLGLNSDGSLPYWAKQTQSPGRASYYNHPSPLPTQHSHPFRSSPPELNPRSSARIAPGTSSSPLATKTPDLKTGSEAHTSDHYENPLGRGAVEQPYAFAPWIDPYAFSDKETQELLASGPNDNIIVDDQSVAHNRQSYVHEQYQNENAAPTSSSLGKDGFPSSPVGLERQNTFEKLSVVGPKGNLTGTPKGTGMKETGSSVADTSSPGVRLSSSIGRQSDYPGFYASPFPATGSVTRISQPRSTHGSRSGRRSSETTLFPTSKALKQVREASSVAGSRQDLRNSTTFVRNQRRTSRSAVPGQTKLRHMFLAPEPRSTVSSQATHITHFMDAGGRPSTSDTNTPLRTSYPSLDIYPAPTHSTIAQKHSPHLLCVERKANPEDEEQRRKLSWMIFAAFCLLPPCIILFRFLGDNIIASMTEGHLGHCTPKSKRVSLIAGIAVNVGLVVAIIVPVLVVHALGNA